MSWPGTILRETFGLFVDDGSFAIAILIWLGITAFLLPHLGVLPRWRGLLLFLGLAIILIASALRYASRKSRQT